MAKVLFDTDIGNDIDDAVALAYLLRQPACELAGVTTVTGDVVKRAALVDAVCRAAGRDDVAIHAGAAGPLLDGPGQPTVPQFDAIAGDDPRMDFEAGSAVGFMREVIRSQPGEVTLLATGPLTNVALLFALDPALPSLLEAFVWMGGVYTGFEPRQSRHHGSPGSREWNARVDPMATAMVFRAAAAPVFRCVGLDVTTQCAMSADDCRARFADSEPLATVLRMAEVWFEHRSEIVFHDPLAAALVFEPTLCTFERGKIHIESRSEALMGLTRLERTDDGPCEVAMTVEAEGFFTHYFEVAGRSGA